MRKWLVIVSILVCNLWDSISFSQTSEESNNKEFNILFYNTENLYDTFDDTLTNDNDFLPRGKMHWTKAKYELKLNNISKVFLSTGIEPPAIIGLAEIENKKVLYDLCHKTPLEKFDYKIIHINSPDKRGIDVGFLYQSSIFEPINKEYIRINFETDSSRKTRDIIYIKGVISHSDTIHLFFNHWPSRLGGEIESQGSRAFVAHKLHQKADSVFAHSTNPNIVIMGDFNDEPDNESLLHVLNALPDTMNVKNNKLYNLSYYWLKNIVNIGTHKYKGKWAILDQIIVSSNMLKPSKNRIFCKAGFASIVSENFLLQEDNVYGGIKPFRTYSGFKYMGGYSDHLPIVLKVTKN